MCVAEEREGNSTEELEMELEALDITDDPLDLDTADETESEELAKKMLDEQGTHDTHTPYMQDTSTDLQREKTNCSFLLNCFVSCLFCLLI